MKDICIILLILVIFYIASYVYKHFILPRLLEMDTKEIEKNPKWIMNNANEYYGFQDIDIILTENNLFHGAPRFRGIKNNRFELLIPNDISVKCADEILRIAIMGKIGIKYGLIYKDKSITWLSALCYMLDGGTVEISIKK